MWIHIASLTVVSIASLAITAVLFVAAVRVIRRDDAIGWIGSPTLDGSPGRGRRSGRLRKAA